MENNNQHLNDYLASIKNPYGKTSSSLMKLADQYEPGLVSIIIPCYNSEKYIADAIDSALSQTYDPKEIIVIDDGSTDHSLAVIKSYGNRITWRTKQNTGAPAARNSGLRISHGEFIQFLDADDILYPKKVEMQIQQRSHLSPREIGICNGEVLSYNTGLKLPPHSHAEVTKYDDWVVRLCGEYIQVLSPLHRRENVLEVGGFNEILSSNQEYALHLRMAAHGIRFKPLNKTLYQVRKRPGSVGSDKVRQTRQLFRIIPRIHEMLRENNTLTDARAAALARTLVGGAFRLFRRGEPRDAWKMFRTASLIHPNGLPACTARFCQIGLPTACPLPLRIRISRFKNRMFFIFSTLSSHRD